MLVRFKLNNAGHHSNISVVGSSPIIGSWNPNGAVKFEDQGNEGYVTPYLEITDVMDA